MDWILPLSTQLQAIGPFTAPLCVALIAGGYVVIKWLVDERKTLCADCVADRNRLREELKISQADNIALRERRAVDLANAAGELQETASAYRESTADTREVLRDLIDRVDRVLDREGKHA